MSVGKRAFNVVLIFCVIGFIFALVTMVSAYKFYTTNQIIFTMDDPKGDDHGPGTYYYPSGVVFDPQKELFDLEKFTAASLGEDYIFDMTFGKITNPMGGVAGFTSQLIQVYISEGYGEGGLTEPLKQGANVVFDSQYPWISMVKVVGLGKTAVFYDKDTSDAAGKSEGIQTALLEDKKTIRVTVPKPLLPGDPALWKYYVLVGALNGTGPDNFTKVNQHADKQFFGGGSDSDFDPNVIDLLASEGKQETMLSSFDLKQEQYASIEPVRPQLIEKNLWERYLYGIIEQFSKIKSKFQNDSSEITL